MNPQSRPPVRPQPPTAAPGGLGEAGERREWDELPSLANILAHYRRHGTLAASVAAPALDEPILGLETREIDGAELFDRYFGPAAR